MKYTIDFLQKMDAFVARVEADYNYEQRVIYELGGIKFVRVSFSARGASYKSSRYFVQVSDGTIFASSSWKKPNFNRSFGTLDTIDQFYWGGYEGVALPNSIFEMKKTVGPYSTAVLK